MSEILDTLTRQLTGDKLQQIAAQLGTSPGQTQQAIGAALPVLVGALERNAQTQGGAGALLNALSAHDGGIFGQLGGLLGGGSSGGILDMGGGILKHVLGDRLGSVQNGLGGATGLSGALNGKLLAILAPLVLGALGKLQRSKGLDEGGLSDILKRESTSLQQKAPASKSFVGGLLDQDGDGDFDLGDAAAALKRLF